MSICLNNQTVGNLKKYLSRFPDDAKVSIHNVDRQGNYVTYDCQIACNFEHQEKTKEALLILGTPRDLMK